jgi:hypothetical protein
MRASRGAWTVLLLAMAGSGCRAPVTILREGTPLPVLVKPDALAAVKPTRIEPEYATLPKADPSLPWKTQEHTYRGLDERTAQCLAAANAPLANLLDGENARPSVLGFVKHKGEVNAAGDDLVREARRLAALDARNRAAMDALEQFLHLADADGRNQLYVAGIEMFDKYQNGVVPKLRAAGLPYPESDDLQRQRATILERQQTIEGSISLLNIDLTARLGSKLEANERFWPVGNFGMSPESVDVPVAVKRALANRADLQLLRMLQDRLNADTLPSVRDSLKLLHGLAGGASPPTPLSFFAKLKSRFCSQGPSPLEQAELESRRKQIAELIAARETEIVAQVQACAEQIAIESNRVALLRSRADSFGEVLAKARAVNKPADVLLAETDHLKARAEVLEAVFKWHLWRVKLKAAQGLLGSECLAVEAPSSPSPGPGKIPVKVQSLRFAKPCR